MQLFCFVFLHALVSLQHQISCVFIFLEIMGGGGGGGRGLTRCLLNEARLADDLLNHVI